MTETRPEDSFLRCVSEWSDLHDSVLRHLEIVPASWKDSMDSLTISAKKSLCSSTRFGARETIESLERVLDRMYEIVRGEVDDVELKSRMKDVVVMVESDFQFKEVVIREICEGNEISSTRKTKLLTMYRQKSFLNPFVVNRSMRYIRLYQAAQNNEKK